MRGRDARRNGLRTVGRLAGILQEGILRYDEPGQVGRLVLGDEIGGSLLHRRDDLLGRRLLNELVKLEPVEGLLQLLLDLHLDLVRPDAGPDELLGSDEDGRNLF